MFEHIDCLFPASLQDALALQSAESTRGVPLGGCTDLMVQWESGALPMPARAVHVRDLPELQGITESGANVIVGASVTHMELRSSPLVKKYAPSLGEAAATVGGFQMQSQGTVAGSIANASPAGDLTPSLFVAESRVVVASVNGERVIPIRDFCQGYRTIDLRPEELIVRFEIPKLAAGQREGFVKLGQRAAQAISKIMGAYRGAVEESRVIQMAVSLGSVAPTAIRLSGFEAWVEGRFLDEAALAEAERRVSEEVHPIDDIRSTADYRKWVAGRLVGRFLRQFRA